MRREQFFDHLRRQGIAEKTVKQYRSNIMRFVNWLENQDPGTGGSQGISLLEKTTQLDVAQFKRSSLERLKPSTIQQTLIHLGKYYDFLVTIGKALDNPVRHIDAVSIEIKTPKWLTRIEQKQLIRAVRQYGDIRELTIITLLLHTGLRVAELCDVKIDDITISERKGKVVVRNGKGGKRREIPLNVDARKIIQQYLAEIQPKGEYLFD